MSGNIKKIRKDATKVCVRARPLLSHEDIVFWVINSQKNTICTLNNKDSMNFLSNNENKDFKRALLDSIYLPQSFTFDKIFNENIISEHIYKDIGKPVIKSVIKGYNGNIFMYGQTTSGKTYTMLGTPNSPGIIPCSLRDIFRQIKKDTDAEYIIYCSYIEIYNENIFDLLNNHSNCLKLFEDNKFGVTATEAQKQPISTFEDAVLLLNYGEENRKYRSTQSNEYSSRSHTLFQIFIEADYSKQKIQENVDLAGSERVNEHEGNNSEATGETGYINKSLFVLGNVIHKLSEGKKDSKLTRILSHGLGGNSLTTIICTISPASLNYSQTLSTLRFATRAKKVSNQASINELENIKDPIDYYKKDLVTLRNDLSKKKEDQYEIINKIMITNESISKELEIYKEKYDYIKEKNIMMKKQLVEMKSNNNDANQNNYEHPQERDFFKTKIKQKSENNYPQNKEQVNEIISSNNNPSFRKSKISQESNFLDTTTKKLISQVNLAPDEKKVTKLSNLNYDTQFLSIQEENLFIDRLISQTNKHFDNMTGEHWTKHCNNLKNDYKNELYALQNAFKDKFKDLFHGHFPNKNINAILKSDTEELSKKNELDESEFVIKMIENHTLFNNIDLLYTNNLNENYEQKAKNLKKIYDEKVEMIENSLEVYKNHLEAHFRKKIQNLRKIEMNNNDNARIPIVSITNEHNDYLKILRTLYDEKIQQIEKKFFDFLKKITKETEK